MNKITWRKTTAKISLKQERSTGFFKKKYAFALMYYVTIEQPLSEETMERNRYNKSLINTMENNLPKLEPQPLFDIDIIVVQDEVSSNLHRALYIQDIEVSKAVYKKYEKAKSLVLEYNVDNPYIVKVL